MRINSQKLFGAIICTLLCGHAWGGPVLTFEGLQNFEQVSNYYDGGTGSLGSGPGPDYGITFSSYGLAYMRGVQSGFPNPFPGDPSPPTVLLDFNNASPFGGGYPTSVTMDVSGGFTQDLLFYYIAIGRAGSVTLYSGLDGTGSMLASQALAITPEAFGGPTFVAFSGTAESVVFTGGNDQFVLDNITLSAASVPEPAAWVPFSLGLSTACLLFARRRKQAIGQRTASC